jgi:Hypoxia induced protein conserved region
MARLRCAHVARKIPVTPQQPHRKHPPVTLIATYAVPLSILAVFGVLLAGLWTMLRGDNPNLSQTLMRWRVGLQFVAVIIIMAAFYLKRGF